MRIVKPKNLLIQIIGFKSVSSGWGDIFCFAVFLTFSGYVALVNMPFFGVIHLDGLPCDHFLFDCDRERGVLDRRLPFPFKTSV